MRGLLKQKVQDADGILCWKSRYFTLEVGTRSLCVVDSSNGFTDNQLDISRLLAAAIESCPAEAGVGVEGEPENLGPGLSVTQVSLEGARRAIAWNSTNAFNGCGFDLVWASGRSWSLLCEEPRIRGEWVDTLNVAIDDGAAISPLREDHLNSSAEDDRRQRSKRSPTRIRRRPHTTKADEKCADRDRRPPDIPRRATATAMFETPPSSAASAIKSSRGESVARAVAGGRHARNSGHNARVFDRERSSEQYWSSSVASECRNAASIHIDSRVAKGNDGKGYRNSHQEECMHDNAPDGGVEERPAATVVDAAADIAMVSQQGRRYIEHTFSAVAPETSAVERLEAKEVSQGGGGLYAVSVRADHGACSTVEPPQSKDEKGGRGSEEAKSGSRIFRAGDGKGGKGKVNGGSAQRSKAKERSEELAKASAATWEQFQHLLKRSRASKKRFDRVMGGSGTSSAPICEKTVVGGRPRLAEKAMDGAARSTDHQPNGAAGHGAVMSRGVVTDSDRSKRASSAIGERSTRARASSEAMIPNSIVNALVSSPERFSSRGSVDAAAAAGATAIWMAELPGAGTDVKADGLESTGVGCGVAGAAVVRDQRGRSGLSTTGVISDAETSLLNLTRDEQPEPRATRRQGGLVFFSDNEDDVNVRSRGTGGVGSGGLYARNDEQTRSPRDKRRGRLSKNATRSPAALSAPVLHAIPATLPPTNTPGAGGGYPRPLAAEDVMHGAAAVRRAPQQQQQTEAVDVQTARRETAKQVERCTALETAAAEAASENDRLKAELATMVTAAAGKRERSLAREKQIAEREKARAEAAAAAADKATRGEMDILKENVEAAERKMESERRESERQREELRRALSAEIKERRRVSELLEKSSREERSLRERLATVSGEGEGDLKGRLATARSELEAVSLERNALAEELDQCIGRLGGQARDVAAALRSRHEREISEITSRCEIDKEALRETIALEADERARSDRKAALSALERRLKVEAAEGIRTEARLRKKQVEEVKGEAEAVAGAMKKDIQKLRGLHAKRVSKLEALLREEGGRLAEARREIACCKANLAGDAGKFQRWTEEQRDQSKNVLEELARIQNKVGAAVKLEAEAREREALAMGRLRKVMEEARLERAEGVEIRRQLREALGELESNRSVQARKARTDIQLQRTAEIAQQEVAMLEAERGRWHKERISMEAALEKLTRLVYGPPRINNNSQNSSNNANMTTNTVTTAANTPTPRTKQAASPWKPSGFIKASTFKRAQGTAAVGGGCKANVPGVGDRGRSQGGGAKDACAGRTVCNPIGVNRGNRGGSGGRGGGGGTSRVRGGASLLGTRVRGWSGT